MSARSVVVGAIAMLGCGRIGFDGVTAAGDDTTGIALTPAQSTINVGSKIELVVDGGTPPYQFALAGDGVLAGTTFVAPSHAGETIATVTDARGDTASAMIRYEGAKLFVVGGLVANAPVPSVLVSDDGIGWTPVGALPAARANGALVVFDDRMFYLGGLNASLAATNDVFASTDGATWTRVGSLPTTNTGFTSIVHRGEMWIVGGATSGGDGVDAYRSIDGATWTPAGKITGPRHEHDLISRDGKLHVIGGHGNGLLDDVQSTTDGSSWSAPVATLTFTADFAATGQLGDLVIRTCGSGCLATETSTDLVTWTPTEPLPGPREGPALVGFGGRMLLIGGDTPVLATTDGTAWTPIGALPAARTRTAAAQFTP